MNKPRKASQFGLKGISADETIKAALRKDLPPRDRNAHHGPKELSAAIDDFKKKNPKIQVSDKVLGSGSFGSTMPTDKGILKVTKDDKESELLKHIGKIKRLKSLSGVPKRAKVGEVDVPGGKYTTIHRENLKNTRKKTNHHLTKLGELLHARGNQIGSASEPEFDEGGKTNAPPYEYSPRTMRKMTYHDIADWHKKVKESDLNPKNKKRMGKVASTAMRLVHHGVIPKDMMYSNWGSRKGKDFVMRDMGLHAIIKDPEVHNHNIKKVIAKLKSLKKS